MRLFGYPYNDLVICKDSPDYLESVSEWLVENRLSLHLGKTESILFGSNKRLAKRRELHITRLWKHTEFRTYFLFVPVWPYSVSDQNCNPLIRYMGTSTEIQFSTLLSRINTKLPTPQNCDFHWIIFCMSIISGCLAYSEF